MKKIIILCICLFVCLTTLTGCGEGKAVINYRFSQLESEIYRVTSRLDRLESKIDLLSWSISSPVYSKIVSETAPKPAQLEKLIIDLREQLSNIKEQLAGLQPEKILEK